ncbi:D-aminoacyl-tRNA deacylase [Haloferax sp. Q22]|uniref:D-aminoacyl-tRNA deacylase n=1 Tax=Haloferax sp. (strain Q22) TaxID=1526048 RepID=UPI000737BB0A|nr:D-aminoacyl-tRNA deacylase [Haloferax sp. Q22]
MIGIVVSRADSASVHIGEHLLELADWDERTDGDRPDADGGGTVFFCDGFELREFDDLHIDLDDPAAAFDADLDLLVVVSRHSGETGALLTAHFTGNFGPADYGGDPGQFARACPNAQRAVVEALRERAPDDYEVGIEATHHGPTEPTVPSMFVELGSDEEQWGDPEGARAVAAAVLDIEGVAPDADRQLVGFGGGHYAPRFERVLRETDWRVGHIAADWQLKAMGAPENNRDVLRRAFEASAADLALVDGDRDDLAAALEAEGFRVVSETWVRETSGVPLDRVAALEADITAVDEGLRFGAHVHADDYAVVSLPDGLLGEAQGIDLDAALDAVRETTVAFHTTEGGTRAVGRAAVAGDGYDELVSRLCDVLREKYDSVVRDDGAVTAAARAFDPAAAREFGVPEGPAFGKLSAGQPVEIDGETVAPEDVSKERLVEFTV